MTFLPDLLSMNLLMTGMLLTSWFEMEEIAGRDDPARPELWCMSNGVMPASGGCTENHPVGPGPEAPQGDG